MTVRVLKVECSGDVRRLRVTLPGPADGFDARAVMADIRKTVGCGYGWDAAEGSGCNDLAFTLKYKDEEGDLCTLVEASVDDFLTQATDAGEGAGTPLRLTVLRDSDGSAQRGEASSGPTDTAGAGSAQAQVGSKKDAIGCDWEGWRLPPQDKGGDSKGCGKSLWKGCRGPGWMKGGKDWMKGGKGKGKGWEADPEEEAPTEGVLAKREGVDAEHTVRIPQTKGDSKGCGKGLWKGCKGQGWMKGGKGWRKGTGPRACLFDLHRAGSLTPQSLANLVLQFLPILARRALRKQEKLNHIGNQWRGDLLPFLQSVDKQLDVLPELRALRPGLEAYFAGLETGRLGDFLTELLNVLVAASQRPPAEGGGSSRSQVAEVVMAVSEELLALIKVIFPMAFASPKAEVDAAAMCNSMTSAE